jgi:hypothetical protein
MVSLGIPRDDAAALSPRGATSRIVRRKASSDRDKTGETPMTLRRPSAFVRLLPPVPSLFSGGSSPVPARTPKEARTRRAAVWRSRGASAACRQLARPMPKRPATRTTRSCPATARARQTRPPAISRTSVASRARRLRASRPSSRAPSKPSPPAANARPRAVRRAVAVALGAAGAGAARALSSRATTRPTLARAREAFARGSIPSPPTQ